MTRTFIRIAQRGASYTRELLNCLRLGATWRDRMRLATLTLGFHWDKSGRSEPDQARSFWIRPQRGGRRVHLRPHTGDVFIFHEIFTFEAYELPPELRAEGRIRTVVDLGANIGMASLYFHDLLQPTRLVAVEPLASNGALLARNLEGLGEGMTAVQAAIGAAPGWASIEDPTAPTWGGRFLPSETASNRVRLATVAEILDEQGLDRVHLMKMDIEGAEEVVFESDASWMSRVEVLLLELHGPKGWELFRVAAAAQGFRILTAPSDQCVLAVGPRVDWI